jgi:hypothetical protein
LVRTGELDRGKELGQQLASSKTLGVARSLMVFHLCCGEIDLAADWAQKAIEEPTPVVLK